MGWSLVLDVLLVLVFIGAVVHGYRAGLLRTAAGLVGLILGGIAAWFVMPWIAGLIPAPEWRAPAAIAAAIVLLSVGAWLGAVVGRALSHGAEAVKLGVLDRVLGAIGNLLVTAFVVALVGVGRLGDGRARALPRRGGVAGAHDPRPDHARPDAHPPRAAAHGRARRGHPLARRGARRADGGARAAVGRRRRRRSSRAPRHPWCAITGTAFQCGSNLSGSGFVVAEDRIVTNAHVVAGVTEPIVEAPGQPALAGRVVAFDRENDLALIAVSGLLTPPLAHRGCRARDPTSPSPATRSADRSSSARRSVMSVAPITIQESGRTSTREIMTLAADVDHGNSGGPVLTGDGAVGGVVFAKSDSVENVGYAIPRVDARAARRAGSDARGAGRLGVVRRVARHRPARPSRAARCARGQSAVKPSKRMPQVTCHSSPGSEPAQAPARVERLGRRGHRLHRDRDIAALAREAARREDLHVVELVVGPDRHAAPVGRGQGVQRPGRRRRSPARRTRRRGRRRPRGGPRGSPTRCRRRAPRPWAAGGRRPRCGWPRRGAARGRPWARRRS